MANPTKVPELFNRSCDKSAPRIGMHFALELFGDIAALTVEDYITVRELFRSYEDTEIQTLKDALNYMNRQLDIVKADRKKRTIKETEISEQLNLYDGA